MTIALDKNVVLESLQKAIAEKGTDYVYPQPGGGCVYMHAGEPSCLVGHVVADLFPDKLSEIEEWDTDNEDDTGFPALQERFHLPLTPAAEQLLGDVQIYQDMRVPWGESLDKALNNL